MVKKTRKKPGPMPSGLRRPVVAMRIHEHLYESIVEEAKRRKLTISEEVQRRLAYYEFKPKQHRRPNNRNEIKIIKQMFVDILDRLTSIRDVFGVMPMRFNIMSEDENEKGSNHGQ